MSATQEARSLLAKFLADCLDSLEITPKKAAKLIGSPSGALSGLRSTTQQLRVLDPLAKMIQQKYRERWKIKHQGLPGLQLER
uniref:Uncharacterized protein n=1 Tax=viral metagenome TaxID=1070528 RepID=A0A6M3XXC9_9ZZZZ